MFSACLHGALGEDSSEHPEGMCHASKAACRLDVQMDEIGKETHRRMVVGIVGDRWRFQGNQQARTSCAVLVREHQANGIITSPFVARSSRIGFIALEVIPRASSFL